MRLGAERPERLFLSIVGMFERVAFVLEPVQRLSLLASDSINPFVCSS
jgi:hypothetical protein